MSTPSKREGRKDGFGWERSRWRSVLKERAKRRYASGDENEMEGGMQTYLVVAALQALREALQRSGKRFRVLGFHLARQYCQH